jgi:hypothetical protein
VFVAIAPVLLYQGFRFLGLTMLAPDQVAPGQDMDAIEVIAYGDLAAAVTGIIAALAAYRRSALTVPLAWLFTVVGIVDLISVGITVAVAGTLEEGIGVMWITFGLIAPLLVLSHGYVLYVLVKRRTSSRPRSRERTTTRPPAEGVAIPVSRRAGCSPPR